MDMKLPKSLWMVWPFICWTYVLNLDGRQGPAFVQEPPTRVDFANTTGTVILCSAHGNPTPSLAWASGDGGIPVTDVPGLRHVRPDGSLVFLPFRAEEYRPDVHDNVYRCVATNAIGTVVSRQVRLKGVVQQSYAVDVYDEFVIRGNTAVLRCHIPGLVRDYVSVTSWIQDSSFVIRPTALAGDRFSVFPSGELHVRRVEPSDSLKQYRCETRHRLTGETVVSATAGRLLLTETFRNSPPRITDSKRHSKTVEGETLEVPCASQGHPPPTYRWFRKEGANRLRPLQVGHRLLQLDGTLVIQESRTTDSGLYVCQVNNSAGTDSVESEVLITAPLTAQVFPRSQSVDVGKSATFNCSVGGHPVVNVAWRKDGRPLRTGRPRLQFPKRDILTITSVQRKDRGMYQCFVSNEFDSAQGTGELLLGDYPPVLLETFDEQTTEPGPPLSLKCVALGSPLPQVTWSLDGAPVPERTRFRMGDYVRSDSTVVSYVNMTGVRVEDGGQYQCRAQNDVGDVSHAARVNVYGAPLVRPMPNVSVVAGETLKLQCPVAGYPIQAVRWEKQGSRLPANHRQKVFPNGTLLVRSVDRSTDEGDYTCIASNKEGVSAQNSAHVSVMVRPVVEAFTFPKSLQEGQRFSVLCTVTKGDAPIKIEWSKDNQPLPLRDAGLRNVQAVQVTEFSSTLVFDSLSRDHSGNYSCEARNRAGSDSQVATMVIHVAPRWRVEPGDKSITKGSSAVVDCQADGYPQPRLRWTKAEGDLSSEFRPISSSSRLHVFENGSLVLHDVHREDAGSYLCQATNGIGQGLSKVIKISVHVSAQFKSKFRSETVRKGQDAKMSCEAVGDRPIRMTWLKDKQPFDPGSDLRYEVTETVLSGGATSELTIRRADRRDSALYTCIASNAFGRDDTNIQLIMQEPPDTPQDVKVLELTSRSVKLGWSPPYSGNSPITQYLLRYKQESEGWHEKTVSNVTVAGSESTVTARGLLPVTFYHFRLSATNALGSSEPSHVLQVKTEEEAPGGPPQKLKVNAAGAHALKVTWQAPRKDLQFGQLRGYYIGYKMADSKESFVYKTLDIDVDDSSRGFTEETQLTNLRRHTKYAVIVQAFNAKGAGPPSDQVFVQTLRNDPPDSPNLKVTYTNHTTIAVSWEPSSENPTDGYIFHEKLDAGEWRETQLTRDQHELLLADLKCGSKYQFYLTAYNSVGRGSPGDIVRARTDGIPPVAPDKHSLLTSINETAAMIRPDAWHDGGCPITSFAVRYRQQRRPGSWSVIPEATEILLNESPLLLRELIPGTWYQLQVTATNDAGSTDAEYTFATPIDSGSRTILLGAGEVSDAVEVPFYLDVNVLVPAAVSLAVVVALLVVACLVAGHKHRRNSSDTRHSDSYGGSRKCQVHESVPLSEVEKNSLKKALSAATPTSGAPGRATDYYPTPYATTRVANAEQEQQQKEARLQASCDEPLYATVKRTPRPPRSDIHIYHYPEGEKVLTMEDLGGASTSSSTHWRERSIGKDEDFGADLMPADCNRHSGKSYRYSQR